MDYYHGYLCKLQPLSQKIKPIHMWQKMLLFLWTAEAGCNIKSLLLHTQLYGLVQQNTAIYSPSETVDGDFIVFLS